MYQLKPGQIKAGFNFRHKSIGCPVILTWHFYNEFVFKMFCWKKAFIWLTLKVFCRKLYIIFCLACCENGGDPVFQVNQSITNEQHLPAWSKKGRSACRIYCEFCFYLCLPQPTLPTTWFLKVLSAFPIQLCVTFNPRSAFIYSYPLSLLLPQFPSSGSYFNLLRHTVPCY